MQIQFRYGFLVDQDGLKVLDVTALDKPRVVKGALVPFADARNLYVARTYAFVAAGHDGLGIVDVEKPEQPSLEQTFNDGGKINDTHDVKIGMTNASQFAYLADGHNGLQVVQIFSPSDNPNYLGFSPHPTPQRIAHVPDARGDWSISEGIDRDRAVDESGNQLAVFGRRGARPFNKAEMEKLFMRDGQVFTVTNTPNGRPVQTTDTGVTATLRRWWDAVGSGRRGTSQRLRFSGTGASRGAGAGAIRRSLRTAARRRRPATAPAAARAVPAGWHARR